MKSVYYTSKGALDSYTTAMEDCECRFVVDRPAHTEQHLEKELGISMGDENTPVLQTIGSKVKNSCTCTASSIPKFFVGLFPIFTWLRQYQKEWLPGDLVAGLTVGVVHIPQSLAFSILAGLAPVFGLYTSFYPVLIYTLMGTSRHISVGTFAVTSLLTRSVVFRYFPPDVSEANNDTVPMEATTVMTEASEVEPFLSDMDVKRAEVAASLMLIMGIFQLLFGIFRLGFITSYLSEPLIQGFTTGAACQVVTSQVPTILGINIQSFNGPGALIFSWVEIFKNLPRVHVATLIISILCILFLVVGREINIRYREKMKIPLPTEVILVIITILASHFGQFEAQFGVTIVKNVPTGLPPPQLPNTDILGSIIGDGFAIAIVGFAISVSLSKLYGIKHGYSIDPNQELVAYGVSNVIPAFFLCFPNAAALARCEIQDNTGGNTQVVGIISVIIVLIVVLVLGPIFEPLPRTVLGSIIVVGLFGILAQFGNLGNVFRTSKIDFAVWIVTWLAVVVLGVDIGLLAGVVFALLTVIARTQRPRFEVLHGVTGTDLYRAKGTHVQESRSTGIVVVKFHASLYYANKDFFKSKLIEAVGFDPGDIINQVNKEKAEREKARLKQQQTSISCFKLKRGKTDRRDDDVAAGENPGNNETALELGSATNDEERPTSWSSDVNTIIVDCGSFGFIDFVGAKVLKQLCKQFKDLGLLFLLANCSIDIRQQLMKSDYFEVSGEDAAFVTVHDAVIYATHTKTT